MDLEHFSGINAGYIEELYERYRLDPGSVDEATRTYFGRQAPLLELESPETRLEIRKIVGAVNLAESIRKFGHLDAQIDPLGSAPPGDPSLRPEFHDITDDDLRRLPANLVVGLCSDCSGNALEAIEALRRVYSSATGHDYAHLRDPEER